MKAFYLEQMGIERWVLKPACACKILIVGSEKIAFPFQGKASILFEQILKSIHIEPADVRYVCEETAQIAYAQLQPKVVWLMESQTKIHDAALILRSKSLEDMLTSSAEKKQIYNELLKFLPHL